jgi:NAD+ synthase
VSLVPHPSPEAVPAIHAFLRAHLADAGAAAAIVGLSGGIDSALVARLAVDALGAGRVVGVLLPDRAYPPALELETLGYARSIGVEARTIGIDPAEEGLHRILPEITDRVAWGNVKARLRMNVLYAIARERTGLVVGTGNKSELLLGYFTKYGDGGADLLPLGDLYKTEVRAIAQTVGIPMAICERAPTAGLWEGQTDEEELGFSYAVADQVLLGLEQLRTPEEIASAVDVPLELVLRVDERVRRHRHKRRLPPIPKLRLRTIGIDWRD